MSRVLVVDDDADFGASLCEVLSLDGYQCAHAEDAQQALDGLRDLDPGVALVDVRLGPEDGVRLVERLRAVRPELVCVMVTAHGSKATAVEALRRGAYDYLEKPLDQKELEAVLVRAFEHVRLSESNGLAAQALADAREALVSMGGVLRHFVGDPSPPLVEDRSTGVILLDEAERIRQVDPRLRDLLVSGRDPVGEALRSLESPTAGVIAALVDESQQRGHARSGIPNGERRLAAVVVPLADDERRTRGYCVLVDGLDPRSGEADAAEAPGRSDPRWVRLSPRQRETAEAAISGAPMKAIAKDLGISVYTVRNHLREVYRTFGVASRGQLIHTLLRPDR